jgi:tape measure domain-containing protein
MAQDMRLVLKITGDASGLKAEIVGAKQQIEGLGPAGASAGNQAGGGMDRLAAGATRAVAALAGIGTAAAAIYSVAKAGDEMNASLGRLGTATGSIAAAADVYDRLYQISLRTGVSVAEGAAAFGRFAIAAREAGASQGQILTIVQLLQQAGALAGASTQETASATLQLGQALASGRLQGDELRSILEAMPNLAEALARELGVGIGELRKMGEEGKLTADVVIPALTRAAGGMNTEFEKLPPSMARSTAILREAMTRLLADLDSAIGLSQGLARAMDGVAGAAEAVRLRLFPSAGQQAANDEAAAQAALAAAQAQPETEDQFGLGPASPAASARRQQAIDAALRQLEAAQIRRLAIEAEGDQRAFADGQQAQERRVLAARERSRAELTALRETLDRREVITREAASRLEVIERGLTSGELTPERANEMRAQSEQRRLADLAKLDEGGRGGGRGASGPTATRAAEGMARVQQENDRARESFDRLRASLDPAEAALQQYGQQQDTIREAMAKGVITEDEFTAAVERSSLALGERLQRAQDEADGTADAQRRVADGARSLGLTFTSAFEDAIVEGKALGDVLKGLEKDLARLVLRKAVTEPLAGAASSGLSGLIGGLFRGGGTAAAASAATPAIDASAGGFLFHTGGVAGHDAAPARRVAASLFATAPRYHAGGMIGPDEVPAILQRGEGVFTAEQMARMGPAGGTYTFAPTINFSGDAGRAEDRDALLAGMRSLWVRDIQAAAPGIVEASKSSLRGDVQRQGINRALGAA